MEIYFYGNVDDRFLLWLFNEACVIQRIISKVMLNKDMSYLCCSAVFPGLEGFLHLEAWEERTCQTSTSVSDVTAPAEIQLSLLVLLVHVSQMAQLHPHLFSPESQRHGNLYMNSTSQYRLGNLKITSPSRHVTYLLPQTGGGQGGEPLTHCPL